MLFSGGFDCLLQAHFIQPDIYLYVDMNSTYSAAEKRHLQTLPKYIKDKLVISPVIGIGKFEDDTLYIPFRNLYLILTALQYGQEIYLGFNEADNAPDKTKEFNRATMEYLKLLTKSDYVPATWIGKNFKILSPYKNLTKTELLRKYIKEGGDLQLLEELRTCYHGKSKLGCGRCSPCINKAVAYINNDLSPKFDKPVTVNEIGVNLLTHLKWRPKSKIINEYHAGLRKIKALRLRNK